MVIFPACLTSEQLFTKSWPGRLCRFDLPADRFSLLISTLQVSIDLVTVAKVVSQDGVYIGQVDDVLVAFGDGFRRHALVVVAQENFQGKAGIADANNAVFIHP
jgi:hypothetical protein